MTTLSHCCRWRLLHGRGRRSRRAAATRAVPVHHLSRGPRDARRPVVRGRRAGLPRPEAGRRPARRADPRRRPRRRPVAHAAASGSVESRRGCDGALHPVGQGMSPPGPRRDAARASARARRRDGRRERIGSTASKSALAPDSRSGARSAGSASTARGACNSAMTSSSVNLRKVACRTVRRRRSRGRRTGRRLRRTRRARALRHRARRPGLRRRAPRAPGADRVQRRDHRRAGREAVVDDDDDAARRIDRRARGRVRGAPPLHRRQLRGDLRADVVRRRARGLRIFADVGPAGLVDGADRVLGIAGRVQLPREHDVEVAARAAARSPCPSAPRRAEWPARAGARRATRGARSRAVRRRRCGRCRSCDREPGRGRAAGRRMPPAFASSR